MKKLAMILALTLTLWVQGAAQEGYVPSAANLAARQEFEDERFGVFIHWGVYSMMARGEWVMQNEDINYQEYSRQAAQFNPRKFDADEWVRTIKASGAKYITITSRHHDGFSMWNSKASKYNIVKATPFKRDVLKELAKACKKYDIKLHFYYSHLDWGRTDFWPRGRTGLGTGRPDGKDGDWKHYTDFMNAQLKELLTKYGPIGAIWFDGVWDKDKYPREYQPQLWNLYEQYALIHKLQPSCLVGNNHHLLPFPGEDIQIFERDIPGKNEFGLSGQDISSLPLETCQTMNGSWGYRASDTNYKSVDFLIQYLVQTAGKGANLLLNIGPKPDGTIPEEAVSRLRDMGDWMKLHGETIYGTRAGMIPEQSWGVTTQKGNKLYVHVLKNEPGIFLHIPGDQVEDVAYFDDGKPVECTIDKDGVMLNLPDFDKPDQIVTVTFKDASAKNMSEAGNYLKFMYDNMSLPDRVTYPITFWGDNVRKALEVRERMGWNVPENEFLHFVLPTRVNNEYLDDFRTTYADTLCNRVKGMSMYDAVLEINHWCHEQATYQPSDARTSAPMATMKAGLGRCGEESVLTVSALRAAGIPARQIYTPRWAHTDDNHAWVEAYVDGKWHFLGACEPEPVLDMGWFNAPVSRAMLLHTKVFGQYNGREDVITRNAAYTEINVTDSYVPVRQTTVKIVDKDGNPVEGANVTYQIYNYAEFYPVVTYKTDANGCVTLMVGNGDITVWAEKDGRFAMTKTRADFTFLTLDHHIGEEYYFEMSIVPPKENPLPANPTAAQVAKNSERLTYEDILRSMHAHGNQAVLDAFKAAHPGEGTKVEAILASLSAKDLNDVSLEVLEDAFNHAGPVFNPLTDAPRIENEYLYPYFSEIGQGLNIKTAFEARVWVDNNIKVDDSLNPQGLRIPPVHVWRSRVADSKSRDIFYVALCRAKGIPATLDAATGKTAHPTDMAAKGTMTVEFTPSKFVKNPEYYRHFSISKIEDGKPKLLALNEDVENTAESVFPLKLDPGYYMMTSGTRMADGSVLAHVEFFNINLNDTAEVPLVVRDPGNQVSVLGTFYADPFIPVTGRGYFAIAVMGDKDEPTVHAVRQLKSVSSDLNKWGRKILVYGKNKPTGLKNAVMNPYNEDIVKTLTASVKSESNRLPIIVVADSFGRVVYYSQGYNTSLGVDLKRVINQL